MRRLVTAGTASVLMISMAFAAPWKQGPHPDLDELAALGERSRRAYERFVLRSTDRAPTHLIVCGYCTTTGPSRTRVAPTVDTRVAARPTATAAKPGHGGPWRLARLPRAIKRMLLARIVWPDEGGPPPLRGGFDDAART